MCSTKNTSVAVSMEGGRNTFSSVVPVLFPGVWFCLQQMQCLGATLKDLETHMCSQVAPRHFVNSTEKGCHGEKNDFREDMAQGWQEAQFLLLLPEACEPPLTHKQHLPSQDQKGCLPQHTWWWVCPYALLFLLHCGWKKMPTAFHLLGQKLKTIINY